MQLEGIMLMLLLNCCSDCICLHITVSTALPTALVKIATPQGLLYPGETVTLRCDISDYTDWTYRWFRNNEELPIQTRKNITISLPDQAGQYRCDGRRRDRPQMSYYSSALPIIITGEVTVCLQSGFFNICKIHFYHNVTASAELPDRYPDVLCIIFTALPKTTLTIEPNPAFTGEKVTLKCSVRSYSIWSYKWFKDRNDNVVSQSGYSDIGVSHISRADVSDQGQYWCEGNRVSRPTSSQPGDPVTLTVEGELLCVFVIKMDTIYIVSEFLVKVLVQCCSVKSPNSKAITNIFTLARKNSLERPKPRKKPREEPGRTVEAGAAARPGGLGTARSHHARLS
uniref:Ig-like domain-containing protein n=1 Tax=Oncorhynchus kisutch TaxID=8019 RepID=A0A8C7JDA2_ONCKI